MSCINLQNMSSDDTFYVERINKNTPQNPNLGLTQSENDEQRLISNKVHEKLRNNECVHHDVSYKHSSSTTHDLSMSKLIARNKLLEEENKILKEDVEQFEQKLSYLEYSLGIVTESIEENKIDDLAPLLHPHPTIDKKFSKDLEMHQYRFIKQVSLDAGLDFELLKNILKKASDEDENSNIHSVTTNSIYKQDYSDSVQTPGSSKNPLLNITNILIPIKKIEGMDEKITYQTNPAMDTENVSADSIVSPSDDEENDVHYLQQENKLMLKAIHALAKAAFTQVYKHYHYKKKFKNTRKALSHAQQAMDACVTDMKKSQSDLITTRNVLYHQGIENKDLIKRIDGLNEELLGLKGQLRHEEDRKDFISTYILLKQTTPESHFNSGTSSPTESAPESRPRSKSPLKRFGLNIINLRDEIKRQEAKVRALEERLALTHHYLHFQGTVGQRMEM